MPQARVVNAYVILEELPGGAMFSEDKELAWKPYRPLPYIGGRWLHRRLPNWLRHSIWETQGKMLDPLDYIDPQLATCAHTPDHNKESTILFHAEMRKVLDELYS